MHTHKPTNERVRVALSEEEIKQYQDYLNKMEEAESVIEVKTYYSKAKRLLEKRVVQHDK